MYDVTDEESFNNVKTWLNEINRYANENVNKLLVGNKSDLSEERVVSEEEGQTLAQRLGSEVFFEVSALSGHNVEAAFLSAVSAAAPAAARRCARPPAAGSRPSARRAARRASGA